METDPYSLGETTTTTTADTGIVDKLQKQYHRRNLAAFAVLGFLNNYYYCVVISAAEGLVEQFGLKSFISLVSWAEIVGGIVVRLLNGFCLAHLGYNWRIAGFAVLSAIGVALVCVAPYCGDIDALRFVIALIGVSFIGNASNYGESALLGYLERMPPSTLAGWSSGTGLSGVAAALVCLGLNALPWMSGSYIFLLNAPTIVPYCIAFYKGVVAIGPQDVDTEVLARGDRFIPKSNWMRREEWGPLRCRRPAAAAVAANGDELTGLTATEKSEEEEDLFSCDAANSSSSSSRQSCGDRIFACMMPGVPFKVIREVHRVVFSNCVNLMLVYCFEYGVQFLVPFSFPNTDPTKKSGGSTSAPPSPSFDWGTRNAFILSQLLYQTGVLMSRSSLSVVRIRRVSILTALQGINFAFWIVQAKSGFLQSASDVHTQQVYTAILLAMMVYVGLLGGASYVNVFFNILNDPGLFGGGDDDGTAASRRRLKIKRQLAMNIGAMYVTLGITLGACVDLVLANAIL